MQVMAGLTRALLSSSLDLKKQTVMPMRSHPLKGLPCPLSGRKLRVLTPDVTSVLGGIRV